MSCCNCVVVAIFRFGDNFIVVVVDDINGKVCNGDAAAADDDDDDAVKAKD